MSRDRFSVVVDPAAYCHWPGGGGFQPVELRVNGRGLLDWVRDVELPYAVAEHEAWSASGGAEEAAVEPEELAGRYLYPTALDVFLPSRNLLGAPYVHGFVVDPDDPRSGKSFLLGCTCGIVDCWFLLATITVTEDVVVWSDFCQFHRDWMYDLGPFTFDRDAYVAELVRR